MVKNRLYWDDAYPIAQRLQWAHSQADPIQVDFVVLREWVLQLPEFADDPTLAQLTMLEDIQREWIDYLRNNRESAK